MKTHLHRLEGCAPTPLAWYLKALGILRILGEQIDPSVRGFWEDECFWIRSVLNGQELEKFFLETYQPTPLIAPWNGGSGFYPKDNREGIDAIAQSQAPRFSGYRHAISIGQKLVDGASERPEKEAKERLLQTCRREWRGPLAAWFEAAVVLLGEGNAQYPALLGTGGNDGRLDFTNNFMQRVADVFDCQDPTGAARASSTVSLRTALWGTPSPSLEGKRAVGQFFPGATGGANGTTGFSSESLSSAWDFILMLEGAVLFGASAIRRLDSHGPVQAAAPFAVRAGAAGYGTAAPSEEGVRGEQWMPLWDRAATLKEVRHLIAEGRLALPGTRIRRPTDVARAIARLGVSRGVSAFQRFGYIERNGQANLATPLGRWEVVFRPEVQLIDDIAGWVERARSALGDKPPGRLRAALSQVDEALLACTRHSRAAMFWQDLLIALGALESAFVASPRLTADRDIRPLGLRSDWLAIANDNSPEFRLAVAFATQVPQQGTSVRRNFLPLDDSGQRFDASENTLRVGPDQVCGGRDLEKDAIALVKRHLLRPKGRKTSASAAPRTDDENPTHFPLVARESYEAGLGDIAAFLGRETDDAKILGLSRGLMAVRIEPNHRGTSAPGHEAVPAVYALLRVVHAPWQSLEFDLPEGEHANVEIRLDPSVFARLAAEDVSGAADIALRRLRATSLRPKLACATGDPAFARRLAASLAFPISKGAMVRLLNLVNHPASFPKTILETEEESQCPSI